ncbi:MAG: ABC transporter permease subunit [Acidobacteriota bacterium]
MKAKLILLVHSLRRVRTLVLVMGTLLGLFQVILVVVASSFENSGQFAQIGNLFPPFMRSLLGPAMASFLSFEGFLGLGYFDPPIIGGAVGLAIALATRLTLEVESGFIDLVLARPVARHWVVTRSILVIVLSIAVTMGMMLAGSWIGLRFLAPAGVMWPSAKLLGSLALSLGMLALSWSGIALMIAAVSRRRGVASGLSGVLALLAFLVDYVARLWEPAKLAARFSPFTYFNPLDLVMGTPVDTTNLLVLGGIAVGSFAAAYVLFLRRDISR